LIHGILKRVFGRPSVSTDRDKAAGLLTGRIANLLYFDEPAS
jgi:hypothetical protein